MIVVIPAKNEAQSIGNVLIGLDRIGVLAVVCDDLSTDGTRGVVEKFPDVRLVTGSGSGSGSAIKLALSRALYRDNFGPFVQMDADAQHPTDKILDICAPIISGRADVVIGSRYCPGGGGSVSGWISKASAWMLSYALWCIGINVYDPTSGFRAYSRAAAIIASSQLPNQYPETEALLIFRRYGLRIFEIPVEMLPRRFGKSTIGLCAGIGIIYRGLWAIAREGLWMLRIGNGWFAPRKA